MFVLNLFLISIGRPQNFGTHNFSHRQKRRNREGTVIGKGYRSTGGRLYITMNNFTGHLWLLCEMVDFVGPTLKVMLFASCANKPTWKKEEI